MKEALDKRALGEVMEMTAAAARRAADAVRAHGDKNHAETRERVSAEATATRAAVAGAHDATRDAIRAEADATRATVRAASGGLTSGQLIASIVLAIIAGLTTLIAFAGYARVGDEPYWPVVILAAAAAAAMVFSIVTIIGGAYNARHYD